MLKEKQRKTKVKFKEIVVKRLYGEDPEWEFEDSFTQAIAHTPSETPAKNFLTIMFLFIINNLSPCKQRPETKTIKIALFNANLVECILFS